VLHKARIDNTQQYVEKKRLRLAERQKDEMPSTDHSHKHVEAKRLEVAADN